ncbi:beta strand repeat-containing protein [Flavobacterium sp. XS2P39]|uniref:beta strand repeat-containing protein n=1 Tax=Flavobacterium sp. XS2P39 TaxID=3401725 RepID=UPI003AAC7DB4
MKKRLLLLMLLVTSMFYAQNNGITYQAVILNPNGEKLPGVNNDNVPLANKQICLQFTIFDAAAQNEYQETIQTTTDEFGMVNLIIGSGRQSGGYTASFDKIVWSSPSLMSLKVALDLNVLCGSYEEISNQHFSSVPFSFTAANAENVTGVIAIENGGTNATTIIGAKNNLGLKNVDNTSDLNKPISIETLTALDLKESTANKSLDVAIDATSNTKYPTVKAVKTYVDANASIGSTALALEITRGINAENALVANLAAETNNRITGDVTFTTNLSSEVGRAIAVENTKEAIANKSINVITDGTSDIRYPTVKAIKSYVDAQTIAGIVDGGISTIKLADGSVTDEKVALGISPTKVGLGNVNNTSDLNKPISIATLTALDLKESTANKSQDIAIDAASNTKYPSVKAVKTYLDANASTGATALAAEVTRATNAENALVTNLATETNNRITTDAIFTTNLASEINRATEAEATKESAANKSFDITNDATSDLKFPSVKAVKTYVDAKTAAAVLASETGANLTYINSPTQGVIMSDTGTSAIIPAGSTIDASLMLPADKIKLNDIGPLTGMVTSSGNVTTVVTNANLTGDVSSFGNTTTIGANKVTYNKLQTMTANKLLGSGLSGTAVSEITLGTGLSFAGSTLNAAAGTLTSVSVVPANGVTGSVTATTTPAITLTLGAITPTSVAATANVTGANLSGTNTGDNAINSLYNGLVTNATHTGDVTGSGILTLATVNANVGGFGTAASVPAITVNEKGLVTAAANSPIQISESQVTNLVTDLAAKQAAITLTTTGTSGASTLVGNILNIPQYSGGTADAATANPLSQFAATTSAQLAGVLSDETGTGTVVFSASPTLTGIALAPTPAVDTNTDQVATTAFVLGQLSSTTPIIDGTAAIGTGKTFARADHVHPTDTSRAPAVGSSSVTTLGTITTGTWNGTTISVAKGGTGATTASLGLNNLLPTQTANAGRLLQTDGTNATWVVAGTGNALTTNPISQFAATTSAQLAGVLSDETGTGNAVFSASPTLVTPNLGTPSTLVGTNITGTAPGLTAGKVTTNADLTGDVTSSGSNTTAIGANKVTYAKIQTMTANKLLGSGQVGNGVGEITLGTGLSFSGSTLNAAGVGGANLAYTNSPTQGVITSDSGTSATVPAGSIVDASLMLPADKIKLNSISGTNTGDQTTITGNAGTATTLQTGRTISTSGDVVYTSPAFNGSANVTAAATISNGAVTYAKLQNLTTNRLLGRSTAGSGVAEEITIGAGLSFSGSTLNATGGSGTVTSVSVASANGVTGTVATATTTPAITLTLGAITPTSVAATGTVIGSNLSGTNTGDQTNISGNAATATALQTGRTISTTGDVAYTSPLFTGSGNVTAAATITPGAVTYGKMQTMSANKLLGSGLAGTVVSEITLGTGLSFTAGTLNATGVGSATNLTYTNSTTQGVVLSDTGTDAIIPAGSTLDASLMLPADKTKLDKITDIVGVADANKVLTVNAGGTAATWVAPLVAGALQYYHPGGIAGTSITVAATGPGITVSLKHGFDFLSNADSGKNNLFEFIVPNGVLLKSIQIIGTNSLIGFADGTAPSLYLNVVYGDTSINNDNTDARLPLYYYMYDRNTAGRQRLLTPNVSSNSILIADPVSNNTIKVFALYSTLTNWSFTIGF